VHDMAGIANALITATPNVAGYPTLSGYTNSNGQVTLPLNKTITYTISFSGPAVGKLSNFTPVSKTVFTLYTVKNKGTLSMSISGQKLSGGKSVYAFAAWQPATLFKNNKAKSTSLVMHSSSVAVSYRSKIPPAYVVDGYNGAYLAENHVYNPATNSWTSKASDTTKRAYIAGAGLSSKVFAIGGSNASNGTLQSTHAYDPSTNTWSALANTGAHGAKFAGTALFRHATGGKSLINVGFGNKPAGVSGSFVDQWRIFTFTYSKNSWVELHSYGSGNRRANLAAAAVGNTGYYVGGGGASAKIFNTVFTADAIGNTYGTAAAYPHGVSAEAVAANGTSLLVAAGQSGANSGTSRALTKFAARYRASKNSWAQIASYVKALRNPAFAFDSSFYVFGGYSTTYTNTTAVYDEATNTWSVVASDPTAREGALGNVV
jgi:hypothetical protein